VELDSSMRGEKDAEESKTTQRVGHRSDQKGPKRSTMGKTDTARVPSGTRRVHPSSLRVLARSVDYDALVECIRNKHNLQTASNGCPGGVLLGDGRSLGWTEYARRTVRRRQKTTVLVYGCADVTVAGVRSSFPIFGLEESWSVGVPATGGNSLVDKLESQGSPERRKGVHGEGSKGEVEEDAGNSRQNQQQQQQHRLTLWRLKMPPNPPSGWAVPIWIQVLAVIAFISSPFLLFALNWFLIGRRAQKVSESDILADNQASFIDKILTAANKLPEVYERLEEALEANSKLREESSAQKAAHDKQIEELRREIDGLRQKITSLEMDRDRWRDQAIRVPQLEGQVDTYDKLLKEKQQELVTARMERDELKRVLDEERGIVTSRAV
jgi:hypothetical protein